MFSDEFEHKDLTKLDNLEWRLRDLLGLKFDKDNWTYVRKSK